VGLIGAGIQASASPRLHEAEADAQSLRCLYQLIDLDELDLPAEAVGDLLADARRMGFRGLNLTHPCKQLALEHLDELSPITRTIGATNTVVFDQGRSIGHNTDHAGFSRSFALGLPGVSLERVVLLGAGGAGTAVAHAALDLGVRELVIADRDHDRALGLARTLTARFGDQRALAIEATALEGPLASASGLIHATPTGMAAHPGLPLPAELLRPDMWVVDIVYMPLETELLREARARGCRTLDGGAMAVFQAADSFELFTGRVPDRDRMLRHFSNLIAVDGSAREAIDGAARGQRIRDNRN
jgi:shikimate dehydrogenase